MREKYYIIASVKDWNRHGYEELSASGLGTWAYVSNEQELSEAITESEPSYIFFLHWNHKVPSSVWQRYECVCFHMTDVPFGRGGSPLQNLIASGKKDTMLTALRMVDEMDAGPIYRKLPLALSGRAEEIYLRASKLSYQLIGWIVQNTPDPLPQNGEVVYFRRRTPAQSVLPKSGTLSLLYDHIRMLDAPTYPNAFLDHGDFRISFSHVEINEGGVSGRFDIRRLDNHRG